ncbi:SusD/RagB family nutrient-binding outer membrane lipoprotein [Flagellimonas lutimaris]|uniref:SusD/RagB family nutrient-binding outer membrane lipoprotein n=1 Tax=Flagellimonas lutimaris TaxID=475082 RepID=A0A3A1N4F5_9FLAO|nr:SusD/RagB family nutrient-binding outer membrane lipoprotein [Allomuricauda lutimaris]RIV31582.1 SusD/RagB family nutrient-binding outer membrane lipoprotein [Allomuricauda lutimaris]
MKKYIAIILTTVFGLGTFYSCDDTLDVNTDPLAATSADPNAVLPYVFVQYSARKVTELGTRICDVPQYISTTFNSPKNGSTTSFLTGNTWRMLYAETNGNLSLIRADAAAAGETSNNVNAIATILSAHMFYEATSIFEDVPFSEALNGTEFPAPKVDAQEDVLRGVVDMLDEAMTMIDNRPAEGEFVITPSSDLFYGGNMDDWRVFANSLKLRVLMMLRNGGANVDAQITQVLGEPLMEVNDQAALIRYSGEPGGENGMNTIITAFGGPDNETDNIFGPGDPLVDLLYGNNDPRLDLWIARNDLPAPGNTFFPDNSTSVLSNNVIRATLPDVIMIPAEIDLYKAELALEGFTAAGDANDNFRKGVTNTLKWWGQDIPGAVQIISDEDISTFVNNLPEANLTDIYNEQYLASFLMPVLCWNNVRRNQIPVLETPPASNISTYLKRFTYPPTEIATNPNIPANKLTDVPMWFENQ